MQAFFFNGFSLFGFGLKVSVNVGPLCWAFAKFRPTRSLGFVSVLLGLILLDLVPLIKYQRKKKYHVFNINIITCNYFHVK